jgi:CelD/BcsL family acetyltransferase involved in cellulose biosynthesis
MTRGPEWKARVVRPREMSANEIELWSSFCRRDVSLAHPFFSYAFACAVERVHPHVFVAVLERRGTVAGFLPFQFSGPLSAMVRAAERVGGNFGDRFGVIAGDDLGLGVTQLLALARLNSLSYSFLPTKQNRHGFSGQKIATGQRLVLSGDERSFWAALKATSRKFASGMERKERVLERELGPITMTFHADPTELPRLIEVKSARYLCTGKNPLSVKWRTDLFRELLQTRDPQCTGVLSTLYAGETWLSSHLGVMSPSVFHHWFPVYNSEWARCSPGHVLTKYLILNALSAGVTSFDFAGYGQYKDFFRPESYEFQFGFWHAAGLGGFVNKLAASLSWRVDALKRGRPQRTPTGAISGGSAT